MKKFLLLAAVMFALLSVSELNAQKKNLIKVNFISPILRTANFQFEHGFEKSSMQLGFYYTGYKISDTKFTGFAITPEYRMYFSSTKTAPEGFFLAPFVRYQNYSLKTTDAGMEEKATLSSFRPGLCVGYQFIFSDIVSFEMFMGPSYSVTTLDVETGDEGSFSYDAFDGFGVRAGMTIGVAF